MSLAEIPTTVRYSLLNQIKGAWLGGIIAEALTVPRYSSDRSKIINYSHTSPWLALRNQTATEIVNRQQLSTKSLDSDYLLLILLPLIFSEHESKELAQINSIKNYFTACDRVETFNNVLLWNYAISSVLKGKLDVNNPIEQILTGVGVNATLVANLQAAEQAFKKNTAFNKLVETLLVSKNCSQAAIVTSIYCFANVPEDFYLAVNRVRSLKNVSLKFKQITAVLTATLSGAYNGLTGVPADWQMFGTQNQIYRQEQKTVVDLFYNWLGAFVPQNPENTCHMPVVAAPKIIQPRSSLNIVSQSDY
ncbi:hypothetical protein [Myxosarcina sp. GI1]|uniref:hypothetical protein n=1 Tax=Myxosarcina sp. GI1 TaxID=1541065 RepID=UPI0005642D9F|nr:hypothetical protein [Myxosarcina sp. GI1]